MHPPHSQLGISKKIPSGSGGNKILKHIVYLFLNGNSQYGCNLFGEMEANCIGDFAPPRKLWGSTREVCRGGRTGEGVMS